MPKATSTANSILDLMYRATPWANIADNASSAPLTSIPISLHTANLTAAVGTQTEAESTYTNYARVSTSRSAAGWTAASANANANVGLIQFPSCGATGNNITHVATGKAASGAGQVFHFGQLNSPLAVANGITPQFAPGGLVVQET